MHELRYERATPCPKCGDVYFYTSTDRCVNCRPKLEPSERKGVQIDKRVTDEIRQFLTYNDMSRTTDIMRAIRANPARIRRLLEEGVTVGYWVIGMRDKLARYYSLRIMSPECLEQFGADAYNQFIAAGWTDDMLRQKGYMK